jgi:hypothetical protein
MLSVWKLGFITTIVTSCFNALVTTHQQAIEHLFGGRETATQFDHVRSSQQCSCGLAIGKSFMDATKL